MEKKFQVVFSEQEEASSAFNQLGEYTSIAKYAQYDDEKKKRESYADQVWRVMKMHKDKLLSDGVFTKSVEDQWEYAYKFFLDKKVLGSQRAMQFGGDAILKKNTRIYNCAATYIDRVRVFQEILFTLLCGSGVGFSVQTHHVAKLPDLVPVCPSVKKIYTPEDSIEGWADCVGVLMSSFFVNGGTFSQYANSDVVFDLSNIRPKGSPISASNGKAPGPEPLRKALVSIRDVLTKAVRLGNRLRPIDVYDIITHTSDAVLAGGIRRSALICIFSHDDKEMMSAKTGSWYIDNPQRGRSNNSALLLRESTSSAQFKKLFDSAKEFGEPGFIWADSTETLFNPCVEACLYGYNSAGESGFQFCNLCEINMKGTTENEFYEICKAAAILGTFQASYTDFGYLGKVTQEIVEHEALLGISMTGMMDNPNIAFDPKILQNGVAIIKKTNTSLALELGINPSARLTCVKPAGTTSCILETSSGIHPAHAKRYFRRVQSNKEENPLKYFKSINQVAVEESVWSANKTDDVITFLCKTPPGALTKNDVSAVQLLDAVKLVQMNWVLPGSDAKRSYKPFLKHNVSNTITIKPDESNDVFE
jgi:ribonucleoside-diphosphate reductase alpha chain